MRDLLFILAGSLCGATLVYCIASFIEAGLAGFNRRQRAKKNWDALLATSRARREELEARYGPPPTAETTGAHTTVVALDEIETKQLQDLLNNHPTLMEDYPAISSLDLGLGRNQ